VAVNVSSPNTPGLRDLQEPGRLLALLRDAVARPGATLRELLTAPTEEQRQLRAWLDSRHAAAAKPATVASPAGDEPVAKSAAESSLAEIWSALLGLDASQVQPGDNFFDLGGSSLLAMQAVAEIDRRLSLKVDPRRYVYESLRQLVGASVAAPAQAASTDHGALARIWAGLLGLDPSQLQSTDNFFDLGGNSLLAMRAVVESETKLKLKIDPRRYVYESLGQLASAPAAASPASEVKQAPAKSRLFGLFGRGKS